MSQDSLLGQPITGSRIADVPLNLLSTLMAVRSGQLPAILAQRQAAQATAPLQRLKTLQLLGELTQAPEVRQLIQQRPALGEALGLPAGNTAANPSPLGPPVQSGVGATYARLPEVVETDKSAQRALNLATADQRTQAAEQIRMLLPILQKAQGGNGGVAGMEPQGIDIGPSGPTIKLGRPSTRTYPVGTLGAENRPIAGGRDPVTGEDVKLTPVAGAGTGKIGESIQRAKSSITNFKRLLEPTGPIDPLTQKATGKRPVDIPPDFSGGEGLTGVANTLRRSVVGGIEIPLTGKSYGEAYLANIANDKTNPDSQAAQELIAAGGAITNVVKGFGDAANVAVPEERALKAAYIPGYGDSPGVGGSAEGKVKIALDLLQNIVDAAEKNPNMTQGQLAAMLNQSLTAAGLPPTTPKEGFDPNAVVGGAIPAQAGAAGPTDGRGAGPTSDIEQRLLQKYR